MDTLRYEKPDYNYINAKLTESHELFSRSRSYLDALIMNHNNDFDTEYKRFVFAKFIGLLEETGVFMERFIPEYLVLIKREIEKPISQAKKR